MSRPETQRPAVFVSGSPSRRPVAGRSSTPARRLHYESFGSQNDVIHRPAVSKITPFTPVMVAFFIKSTLTPANDRLVRRHDLVSIAWLAVATSESSRKPICAQYGKPGLKKLLLCWHAWL
jgi:hypothetical protein